MKNNKENIINKYKADRGLYEEFTKEIERIVRQLIHSDDIIVHAIVSRTKGIESFTNKINNEKHENDGKDITDCSGVRIITYIESDLQKISDIVEKNFNIDKTKSLNKTHELGSDKVGYRSIHFVGTLSNERLELKENHKFKDLCFEIQIRTVLQHARAEIEHDKNYKYGGELPENLQRRFYILAGVLELADREFSNLVQEIDVYSKEVEENIEKSNYENEINSISLKLFMNEKFSLLEGFQDSIIEGLLLKELNLFGITNLDQLNNIIPTNFYESMVKESYASTYSGFLRDIMIINNSKKYFTSCRQNNWDGIDYESIKFLRKYIDIDDIINNFGLEII